MLRRSLCQDMVIIKKIYPSNPLSRSEIFNSPEFLNFAQSIDNERLNTIINKSCFIPNEDNIICDDNEGSLRVGSSDNTNSKSASKELKLKTLNKQMNLVLRQQQEINQAIYKFTKSQTEIFQKQNELIQKVNQSLNGVLILLSAQNKTSIPLVQQAAQETQNYLSTVGQSNIERGINNTFELLNVLNSNSGHSQPPIHSSTIYTTTTTITTFIIKFTTPRNPEYSSGSSFRTTTCHTYTTTGNALATTTTISTSTTVLYATITFTSNSQSAGYDANDHWHGTTMGPVPCQDNHNPRLAQTPHKTRNVNVSYIDDYQDKQQRYMKCGMTLRD